jgi:hypothetical protein
MKKELDYYLVARVTSLSTLIFVFKGIFGNIFLKYLWSFSIDSLKVLSIVLTCRSEPITQARGNIVAVRGILRMLSSTSTSYSMKSSGSRKYFLSGFDVVYDHTRAPRLKISGLVI